MTVKERALNAVLMERDAHAKDLRGEGEDKWMLKLFEEVWELNLALDGKHAHTPDMELVQIASICLNWLEYRMQTGWGQPEPTIREALKAMVDSVREGAGVCDGRAFVQGEDALRATK